MYVNNFKYRFLLDTGASLSVIQYDKNLRNFPMYQEFTSISGVGGVIHTLGTVQLTLESFAESQNLFTVKHKFHVVKHLPIRCQGILGMDFLTTYSESLNFHTNEIVLNNKGSRCILDLAIKQSSEHNTNTLFVKARTEGTYFVNVANAYGQRPTTQLLIQSAEIQEGVFVANALVRIQRNKIPVRIINMTEQDVTLNNFIPSITTVSDYHIFNFEPCENNKDSKRVQRVLDLLNTKHLNEEESSSLINIIAKFPDVFYLKGDKLTTTNVYEYNIQLKPGSKTVYTKPYRLPYAQKEEVNRQIQNMLDEGILEPTNSSYSSPVLLVPKKSNDKEKKFRLVVDYRKLNEAIVEDRYPLPNITEVLDALSGCVYFSHLDLYSGFYQLKLNKDSRKYTAIQNGQYQLTRLPMGIKTSPSAFSRMMNLAMSGLTFDKCMVYQDDLSVMGKSLADHNKNLLDVLTRLRKVNLKLNIEKCEFLKKELLYLGHVVSEHGIQPDPGKIKVLKEYPVPTNADEVRRFVAFTNYYRKFIPNFAKLTVCLTKLTKKNVKFVWSDECQKSFELLKEKLMSPPILQYPDFSEKNEFTIQCDASGFALGSVLTNKNGSAIAYASRMLNKGEINYPVIEKELLSIVWAIKHFRPYLYGRRFRILTDHRPLVYLFGMKDPSSRLIKFRLALEEYDFYIEYIKGSLNGPADALSRIRVSSDDLKGMSVETLNVMTRLQKRRLEQQGQNDSSTDVGDVQNQWEAPPKVVEIFSKPTDMAELVFISVKDLRMLRKRGFVSRESSYLAYAQTKGCVYIKPEAEGQTSPDDFVKHLVEFCKEIKIKELCYIRVGQDDTFVRKIVNAMKNVKNLTLCILKKCKRIEDKNDIRVILNDFHILPTSGHAGIKRMLKNIKRRYFWTSMEEDITKFVNSCTDCQKQKYTKITKQPMEITTTANTAFEKIYLDIVGPLDRDNSNYNYILTLQCELTKFVCAFPLTTKSSAEVAKTLVEKFILKYGIPNIIATDRGTEFTSELFKNVCKLLKIKKLESTSYRHESIGSLEVCHKNLAAYLRIQCEKSPYDWSDWLPYWSFSYNTTVHSETKYSPYELVFGKACLLPSNLKGNNIEPLYNFDDYPSELKYRLSISQRDARKNLLQSKLRRKQYYDRYTNPTSYNVGDEILVKNETGNKLSQLYLGPYTVIKEESPNVVIKVNGRSQLIHKNRTKLYKACNMQQDM